MAVWTKRLSGDDAPFTELEFKRPTFHFEGERWVNQRKAEARALGEKHGRAGVPGPDHPEALQVNAYSDEGERLLGHISQDWHEVNRVLQGEWCRLRQVVVEREKQLPPAKVAVKKVEKRVDNKQAAHDKEVAAARAAKPGTRHHIGRIPYVLGLIAVFLVDVPLNAAVFQIFGENQLATWALAALLGILVVPAAHVLGTQIRNRFPDRVITSAALVVPLLLMIAIAVIRTKYLEENNVDIGGATGVLIFLIFNLAVFGAAVFLSYLRHDPYEEALEETALDLRQAQKELAVAVESSTRLEKDIGAIRGRIAEIYAWGQEELKKAQDWANAQRNFYEQLIDEYLAANQTARDRPQDLIRAIENSKRKKPSLSPDLVPGAKLHWTCGDASTDGSSAATE